VSGGKNILKVVKNAFLGNIWIIGKTSSPELGGKLVIILSTTESYETDQRIYREGGKEGCAWRKGKECLKGSNKKKKH